MKRLALTALLVTTLAALSVAGCKSGIGASCTNDSACASGLYCERSLPGGYCTVRTCLYTGCPKPGVCIRFSQTSSYCMAPCAKGSDCRTGYTCVRDFGSHLFCGVGSPLATTSGPIGPVPPGADAVDAAAPDAASPDAAAPDAASPDAAAPDAASPDAAAPDADVGPAG